ncbi:secreted RxLR effector protein 161-like [Nicotiana tomentosiformis]|uniref:secreted RxLR effector protein 161-like n=1 Tax=Nicotiana tomentosiformis TaxID=4098 RepID=UPI00087903E1|nr:secreted RxLR effector protein 161-like [Nicotiana tomentosiformis]
MHQRKYTLVLISELGLGAAKPAVTPIEGNVKLTTKEYDEHIGVLEGTTDETLRDPGKYQRLLGKLLYLTVTRPDIAYSVQTLSQFIQKPKRSHMEAAQRVVKYVKGQPGQGILLSSRNENTITAYCDADWAACLLTRKSVTGFFIKYGESLVSWKSKKQNTISRSSAKSEYTSIASTVAELVLILGLFKDIGVVVELPVNILTDSNAAIQIAANPVFHERTK